VTKRPGGTTRLAALGESLIVGDSHEMADVIERIEEAAHSDAPVLIEGEAGTGRELVARAIHYGGPRRAGGFVSVKAASIPSSLVADELFGPRSGSLRRASGGTLLLKGVEALPSGPQRGLAKVLKTKRTPSSPEDRPHRDRDEPSGESVDVRVIGASDGALDQAVNAHFFDKELYDRLGARRIKIPPLRRRLADFPKLVRHFLSQTGAEVGRPKLVISEKAMDRLVRYSWPGNVAELKDTMRRLIVGHGRGNTIDLAEVEATLPTVATVEEMALEDIVRAKLKGFLSRVGTYDLSDLYGEVISHVERPLLALVMEHAGQNQLKAAKILGMNRNTLRKKLAEHALVSVEAPPEKRPAKKPPKKR
jgi:two-component system, NtrC family, nitrogen regulation response regulator GlnG